jgi:hypothetical protein
MAISQSVERFETSSLGIPNSCGCLVEIQAFDEGLKPA